MILIRIFYKSYKRTVYHPRQPEASPLWRLLNSHYEGFEKCYEKRFEGKYGLFRHVIGGVVRQYLTCGDLKNGFARVRCRAPLLHPIVAKVEDAADPRRRR